MRADPGEALQQLKSTHFPHLVLPLFSGGDGSDTLTGGSSSDAFVFEDASGSDTVTDFYVDYGANGGDQFCVKRSDGRDCSCFGNAATSPTAYQCASSSECGSCYFQQVSATSYRLRCFDRLIASITTTTAATGGLFPSGLHIYDRFSPICLFTTPV